MKFLHLFLMAVLALPISTAYAAAPLEADTVSNPWACLAPQSAEELSNARAWWNRRTAEEQSIMLSLPCEERFMPAVCIFLFEPDLKSCTAKRVADYRANRVCDAKGLELLTQEFVDCTEDYKRKTAPIM